MKRAFAFGLITLATHAAMAAGPKLSVGDQHMLLLRTDGSVLGWGRNQWGQIDATHSSPVAPVVVPGLSGVVDVIAVGAASFALKADGTVWEWGSGGAAVRNNVPTMVPGVKKAKSLATGYDSTGFAVDLDGNVFSWGNSYLLGYASANSSATAKQIPNVSNVVKVAAGGNQAVALRADGSVLGWGYNRDAFNDLGTGVFGDPTAPSPVTILAATKLTDLANTSANSGGVVNGITTAGTIVSWGDTGSGYIYCGQERADHKVGQPMTSAFVLENLAGVTGIAGGGGTTLFLTNTGAVYACGYNSNGAFGDGTTQGSQSTVVNSIPAKIGPTRTLGLPATVVNVAAGGNSAGAVTAAGEVYTWGNKGYGVSGDGIDGGNTNALLPVKTTINAGALASAGPVYAGTQTGNLTSATVDVGVGIAPAHQGQQGQVYVAILTPAGSISMVTPNGVVPLDATHTVISPYYAGKLGTHYPIHLFDNVNVSTLNGAYLLTGYGLGTGDNATIDLAIASRFGIALQLK
jgi:alpha-tubulin suppressor-like RCC1 family protein